MFWFRLFFFFLRNFTDVNFASCFDAKRVKKNLGLVVQN